jgi:hypothetical protein
LLTDCKLYGCIKWHPPFISSRNRAGEANLVLPMSMTSSGGCGLFAEVKLEGSAGELPVNRGPWVGVGPHHIGWWGSGRRSRGRLNAAGVRCDGFAAIKERRWWFVIVAAIEGAKTGQYKVRRRVILQVIDGRLGVRRGVK